MGQKFEDMRVERAKAHLAALVAEMLGTPVTPPRFDDLFEGEVGCC